MEEEIICSLSEEMRNKINSYMYDIAKKEIAVQTLLYIKHEQKVGIDDSMFDIQDKDSKVAVIKAGLFNPKDYESFYEFMTEPTDEIEYRDYYGYTEWKYKSVGKRIAEISLSSLINKKEEIIEVFIKNLDLNLELNEHRFYIKSEERKEAIDISLEIYENIDFNKICFNKICSSIEKNIQVIYNVMKKLKEELFYNIYILGCRELCVEPDYKLEIICSAEENIKDRLYNILIKQYVLENVESRKIKVKNLEGLIDKQEKCLRELLDRVVTTSIKSTDSFFEEAKKCILDYLSYKKYQNEKVRSSRRIYNEFIEDNLSKLIEKIAVVETYIYTEYKENNDEVPSIEELISYEDCHNELAFSGIISLIKNTYVKDKTKFKISSLIPSNPKDEYPKAREMKRKFFIHTGLTNTGKTFSSIERLKQAESGVYLAPLRLLALEVQERLNESGISCSLVTGEEENIISYASHISSTVEKLDIDTYYDICVIDECQMIGDSKRGFAWTRAILGSLSKEIHLCTAPEGLDILIKIIEDCNDEYEVINHTRDTELVFLNNSYDIKNDIQKGDALIVFSKKNVLAVAAELLNNNVKASIIYGSLPYSTRKKQFMRFLTGKTDVIVSTDAIGMGINLPIKRVIFLETSKYDGQTKRSLKPNEIKQISGRAGRKGIYDKGYVMAAINKNMIQNSLRNKAMLIKEAYVGFSDVLLNIDEELADILKVWKGMSISSFYNKTEIKRALKLIQVLKDEGIKLSKEEMLKMVSIPIEENKPSVFSLWKEYCYMYTKDIVSLKKPACIGEELDELEDYYKCLDLYYSFGKIFKLHIDLRWLKQEKLNIADKINDLLINTVSKHARVCTTCGAKLKWDFPYNRCNVCYYLARQKENALRYTISKHSAKKVSGII